MRGQASVSVSGNPLDVAGQLVGDAAKVVTGSADRYLAERQKRVDSVLDHASQGRIVDAAVDAFQLFSSAGAVADGAKALGLVRNDADKFALSAILNAVLCGPFGAVAAAGDAEDSLRARLPELRRTAKRCNDLGIVPHRAGHTGPAGNAGHRCAGSHEVERPSVRFDAHVKVKGYARTPGGSGRIDIDVHLRSGTFHDVIKRRHAHPGILGPFSRDLAKIIAGLRRQDDSGAHDFRTADGKGVSNGELRSILDDPSLSFEDKLFLFILAVAAKQEDKITKLMERYERESKQDQAGSAPPATGSGKATAGGQTGQSGGGPDLGGVVDFAKGKGPDIIRFGGAAIGIAAPVLGTVIGTACGSLALGAGAIPGSVIGGAIGSLVGLAAGFGSNMLADGVQSGAFDKVIPGMGGGGAAGGASAGGGTSSGSATGADGDKKKLESENQAMQLLQYEQNKLTKMYEMISNMMKSMHDTQMSAIRNMR